MWISEKDFYDLESRVRMIEYKFELHSWHQYNPPRFKKGDIVGIKIETNRYKENANGITVLGEKGVSISSYGEPFRAVRTYYLELNGTVFERDEWDLHLQTPEKASQK